MTTVLQARPRRFVSTPAVERITARALRYLQSGFSVHLRGPAGTGKTTLALHIADLLSRPIMLLFGDDEFKTSDLIGNQSGYTRKKVVDNFIHSVVKVEDELKQNWVDSRLTLACREGFTLVYDEFNRSRPEVNNVLLSALEERLLVLPPSGNRAEYIRVHPEFCAIFTSNPEEYCGVHSTQDALMDRLVTINVPEPDELTQQEILVQKVGVSRESASLIVRLVKAFRVRTNTDKSSGLRACLMLAKVCHEHGLPVSTQDPDFRDICQDVLLSRSKMGASESSSVLWGLLNEFVCSPTEATDELDLLEEASSDDLETLQALESFSGGQTSEAIAPDFDPDLNPDLETDDDLNTLPDLSDPLLEAALLAGDDQALDPWLSETADSSLLETLVPPEQQVYQYLKQARGAKVSEIEAALGMNRFQTVDALRSLSAKGILTQRDDRLYIAQ